MKTRSITLLLGLSAVCFAAAADAGVRDGSRLFERLDGDGDGVISEIELTAQREQLFERLDSDGDGVITAAERDAVKARAERIRERVQAAGEERFEDADTDGDGNLTREEFLSAPTPLLVQADADGDGRLTRGEFDDAIAQGRGKLR